MSRKILQKVIIHLVLLTSHSSSQTNICFSTLFNVYLQSVQPIKTMSKSNIIQKNFPVIGMSCAACAARVEKNLAKQPGVTNASVNLAAASVSITFDDTITNAESLQHALKNVGFELIIEEEKQEQNSENIEEQYHTLRYRATWALLLSLPIAIIGMFFMHLPYAGYIMWILSTPVVFWLGRSFFVNAWKLLKHGSFNMDTLVANSTGIAYLFSLFNLFFPEFWLKQGIEPHVYFEASAIIIAFILLGKVLEARAKGNTTSAIKKLIGLQPQTVTRINNNGEESTVPITQIRPGNLIMVKPGERIAVDGIVTEGNSFVDESMLSGEFMPVGKQKGAFLFAGTINQNGTLHFKASKVGEDTLLAKIIHMVQNAQGSKVPVQRLVDKIAAIFVPTIMTIALLAFLCWVFSGVENGFTYGLLALVTVLIIACPCALGLATPTAIMVGIGKGAELGILIKDAQSLEVAKDVDTIVIDKTGTLTQGHPKVTDMMWSKHEEHLKHIFYSLEKYSEHPLSEAIVKKLNCTQTLIMDKFECLTGIGIKASYQGRMYYAGNLKLLTMHGITPSPELLKEALTLEAKANTIVWFADESEAYCIAAISDELKSNSIEAINQLHKLGINIIMLSGDNATTAANIAQRVGISHFHAEVLPQEKAQFIKQLQQEGKIVAMVGDGINDSAALAQANLSIAMGNGSDIAIDTAQMTIISSDLRKIADAIKLSRLTVRTIKQNLFWAFFYNMIGIPIAAGILYPINGFLLNPMIAGAAMAFSSVSVVTNSLRIKRTTNHKLHKTP